MKRIYLALSLLVSVPSVAGAAPGLDSEVYGATVVNGQTEIETRYGRLTGGSAEGKDALVLELAHGFSSHFYGAALAGFDREPQETRRLRTLGLEGIVALGQVKSLDLNTALYVEYEHSMHGPDNLETKLLLERQKGRFDTRLNLIAERALRSDASVDFSYAASASYAVSGDDVWIGAEAFGDLGNSHRLTTHGEHFIGPAAQFEVDHFGPGELELRAGYLFAINRARSQANGQLRFGLEFEF